MAKRISSRKINGVLCYVFTDGRIHHRCILSVFAFTAYYTLHHTDDAEVITEILNNFYVNLLNRGLRNKMFGMNFIHHKRGQLKRF